MKKIILLISMGVILYSCGKSLDDVKPGMNEKEVEEMLGKANRTSSSSSSSTLNGESVTEKSTAEWTYNGKGKIKFEDGKVVSVNKE